MSTRDEILSSVGLKPEDMGPTADIHLCFDVNGYSGQLLVMTKENTHQLPEHFQQEDKGDFTITETNIALVACDGVTRDAQVTELEEVNLGFMEAHRLPSYLNHLDLVEKWMKKVPNPSPAMIASVVFSRAFVSIDQAEAPNFPSIQRAFIRGNRMVDNANQILGLTHENSNYLDKVPGACFAAGVLIDLVFSPKLFYGFIGDCGLAVYSKYGVCKFISHDQVAAAQQLSIDTHTPWEDPHWRILANRFLVNGPTNLEYNGDQLTYGLADGSPNLMNHLELGRVDLSRGDWVIVYTDGATPFVQGDETKGIPEMIRLLLSCGLANFRYYWETLANEHPPLRKEGTLVILKINE